MRRDEFMRELEYLLQDIPDEDKADAVGYYQDYLDEAGPENEEEVLRGFGSPERIAAIIRADLNGNLEEGGEFTDQGYEDERFREPNFQLAERLDLPEQVESGESSFSSSGTGGHQRNGAASSYTNGTGADTARSGRPRWSWWQILGMILLGCCVLPVLIPLVLGIGGGAIGLIFGLGGGAVGLLAGVGGVLAALTIALAAVTFALLLAGVLLIIFGIGHLASPAQGFLYMGTGIGILGLGFLCLALCGLYYGRFLPWLGRAVIDSVSRLIHRKEASSV